MNMKMWTIARKDNLIRFRDRNGLLLMLAAPLVLAAIVGAAFGGFGGGGSNAPLTGIPFVVVNADEGDLGRQMVEILKSDRLAGLLAPTEMTDLDAARQLVEQGKMRAALFIPLNFSASVQGGANPSAIDARSTVTLHVDPASTFSPLILRAVVIQIVTGFNAGAVGGRVVVAQLEASGQMAAVRGRVPAVLGEVIAKSSQEEQKGSITLNVAPAGSTGRGSSNPLAYFAPAMAILFLMFSLFDASNSILEEEREGTLARLMSTPTGLATILGGKIGGVFLTGLLQLGVLILASRLLFGLEWGSSPLGLALIAVATVAAASSLGVFIVAFARDASQAGFIGASVALISAILGGTFIAAQQYPAWLQPFSKLTINRWALDGFTDLTLRGQGLLAILPEAAVLLGIAAFFFSLALWRLPRRFVR